MTAAAVLSDSAHRLIKGTYVRLVRVWAAEECGNSEASTILLNYALGEAVFLGGAPYYIEGILQTDISLGGTIQIKVAYLNRTPMHVPFLSSSIIDWAEDVIATEDRFYRLIEIVSKG